MTSIVSILPKSGTSRNLHLWLGHLPSIPGAFSYGASGDEMRIFRAVGPVSYTHLDVYKRQKHFFTDDLRNPGTTTNLINVACSRAKAKFIMLDPSDSVVDWVLKTCLLYTSRCV